MLITHSCAEISSRLLSFCIHCWNENETQWSDFEVESSEMRWRERDRNWMVDEDDLHQYNSILNCSRKASSFSCNCKASSYFLWSSFSCRLASSKDLSVALCFFFLCWVANGWVELNYTDNKLFVSQYQSYMISSTVRLANAVSCCGVGALPLLVPRFRVKFGEVFKEDVFRAKL